MRKRAEWIGFFWVTMRTAPRMAIEAVPRKINHWKIMLIFCSNMKTLSRKSIVLTVEGKVTTFQISKSKKYEKDFFEIMYIAP
jgi:hypothetical protein